MPAALHSSCCQTFPVQSLLSVLKLTLLSCYTYLLVVHGKTNLILPTMSCKIRLIKFYNHVLLISTSGYNFWKHYSACHVHYYDFSRSLQFLTKLYLAFSSQMVLCGFLGKTGISLMSPPPHWVWMKVVIRGFTEPTVVVGPPTAQQRQIWDSVAYHT